MSGAEGPRLLRPPLRQARSRLFDSARWQGWRPRAGDVIVATYPKCGTTWTQRIVQMLLSASTAPASLRDSAIWPDWRQLEPAAPLFAEAEAQTRRRQFKTHLPLDCLPLYEGVKVIHIARDGRDAALSFHNHETGYTDFALGELDKVSLADPRFGAPYPRPIADPAKYFHAWVQDDGRGDPACSFFSLEPSYWAERRSPDVLLTHFADLKADLASEIARIADFLGTAPAPDLMEAIVAEADFEAMRREGATLMPRAVLSWKGGSDAFLRRGENGGWRGVFAKADLAAYEAKAKAAFSPALARWLEQGRLKAGDPALAAA